MELVAKNNLIKLQSASNSLQLRQLYTKLKSEGQFQEVVLSDFKKKVDLEFSQLDYNGNVFLQHFGGEHNKLVAYQSSPDGNCFYNSLSILLYGDESSPIQLRYLLTVFIIENYDSLLLNNPTVNLPNLNTLLGFSIDDSLMACSRIPDGSRAAWSTSMTGFLAAQAFNISLNVIYPPVSGFEDPYFLFPQRHEGHSSILKVNILWTSSNLVQSGGNQYMFNHFVPCVNHTYKRYEVPESHLSLLENFKQKLFSPLTFTGYPTNFSSLKNSLYPKIIISNSFDSEEETLSKNKRADTFEKQKVFVQDKGCEKEKSSKDLKSELNNEKKNSLNINSSVNSEKLIFKHDKGDMLRNSKKTDSPEHKSLYVKPYSGFYKKKETYCMLKNCKAVNNAKNLKK